MTFQSLFIIVGDTLLTAAIVVNWSIAAKNRKLLRKLQRLNRDHAPILVEALDRLATGICPLCAVASGQGEMMNPETNEKLTAEPESNGEHVIYVDGRKGQADCIATKVREDGRRIVAGEFKTIAQEKTVWRKSK